MKFLVGFCNPSGGSGGRKASSTTGRQSNAITGGARTVARSTRSTAASGNAVTGRARTVARTRRNVLG